MAATALNDQKKRSVVVKKDKLLEQLRENRDKHEKEYHEAMAGYKAMAEGKLREAFEKAKSDLDKNFEKGLVAIKEFNPETAKRRSDYLTLVDAISVELRVPRNFSAEYDTAIEQVKWDTRTELELTYAEFQCFVRDIWEWSDDFNLLKTIYMAK